MADFQKALAFVLPHEGGYEPPAPDDPGGETKFGISKKFASQQPGYADLDIKNLTVEQAAEIYAKFFWHFGEVADQDLANKMLDVCVNLGPHGGVRLIEQALVIFFPGQGIAIDGVWGPHDLELVNRCDPKALLVEIRARQAQRYCQDMRKNPAETPLALGLFRRAAL